MTVGPWLTLGRVSNLPTVWTNALTAIAVSTAAAHSTIPWWVTAALSLGVSLFYTGGMFLNDAFDHAIDAVERPERPIPSGSVRAGTVFRAGFAQLAAGAFALTAVASTAGASRALATLSCCALLAAAIVAYDMRHKGNSFAPLLMALCRALVYVCVGVAVSGVPEPRLLVAAGALTFYVAGLTYVAAQENLTELGNLWPVAVLAVAVCYTLRWLTAPTLASAVVVLFVGWTAYSLSFVLRMRPDVRGAVTRLIAGISLLDAVFIAAYASISLAVYALVACVLTRVLQRFIAGT